MNIGMILLAVIIELITGCGRKVVQVLVVVKSPYLQIMIITYVIFSIIRLFKVIQVPIPIFFSRIGVNTIDETRNVRIVLGRQSANNPPNSFPLPL